VSGAQCPAEKPVPALEQAVMLTRVLAARVLLNDRHARLLPVFAQTC
jgi:hypothetical protein